MFVFGADEELQLLCPYLSARKDLPMAVELFLTVTILIVGLWCIFAWSWFKEVSQEIKRELGNGNDSEAGNGVTQ